MAQPKVPSQGIALSIQIDKRVICPVTINRPIAIRRIPAILCSTGP